MPVRVLAALAIVAILLAAATWSVWVLPRASWVPMPPAGRLVLGVCVGLSLLAAGLGLLRAPGVLGLSQQRASARKVTAFGANWLGLDLGDARVDGESLTTPAPQSFGATVDQGRLKYQFTLPIRGKGAARGTVDIVVDDPNYFVAFALAPGKAVTVTAAAPFVAECRVSREKAAYTFDVVKCTYTRRGR